MTFFIPIKECYFGPQDLAWLFVGEEGSCVLQVVMPIFDPFVLRPWHFSDIEFARLIHDPWNYDLRLMGFGSEPSFSVMVAGKFYFF